MTGPVPDAAAGSARPRGGRPPREASARLRERLLDVATEMLLTQGYGPTSIEAVAARAGVAKRTFYHRFEDKAALMTAVVARLIDGLRPPAGVPLIEGADLRQILLRLAGLILRAALAPTALALHRLIVAEAQRFPDLARAVAQAGGRNEAVRIIGELLQRHAPGLQSGPAEFAAQQFLQLVVSVPQMRAMGLGQPMSAEELEAWTRASVELFLGGFERAAAPAGQ